MPEPSDITQSATGSYNAQAADHSTAIVNVYGQPVQASELSSEDVAAAQARYAQLPTDVVPPIATLPEASRMPFANNPNFVGRADDLKRFAQILKVGTPVATGLGGIGKTQAAVEFVHRYGTYFMGGVFWLSFATAEGVPAEIAQCGNRMNLRLDYSGLNLESQVQLVRAAWESDLPRLLVFDNCEDEGLLRAFRPVTGGSRVLVTSRRGQWDAGLNVRTVAVGMLSTADSAALLRQLNPQLPPESDVVLRQIAEELGGLPLALHLAGSYLREYRRVLAPEQVLVEIQRADMLARNVLSGEFGSSPLVLPTQHDVNVYRTFHLSYRKLDESRSTDAQAVQLLMCAACLAPGEPVPHGLLAAMVLPQDPSLDERIQVEDALARLTGLGLLESASEQPPTFRLHRLLMRFVQKTCAPSIPGAQERVEQVVLGEAESVHASGLVKPLVELQAQLFFVTGAAVGLRKAALGTVVGNYLKSLGDYPRAKEYYDQALRIRLAELGEARQETAASLTDVGFILKDMGRFPEAQPYFDRALKINVSMYGAESAEAAISLDNLGLNHKDRGYYVEAQGYFEQALRIKLGIHGERHQGTVDSYNNLGFVLMDQWLQRRSDQKLYDEARRYLEQALKINVAMHGEKSREVAWSLNSLGELLVRRGDADEEARRCFEQALEIRKGLDEGHPETAEILNNLGRLLLLMGENTAARHCLEQALAIREEVVGKDYCLDTLSSARILSNLGNAMYGTDSDLYRAKQYLEQALQTFRRILGPEHQETRMAAERLGSVRSRIDYWSNYYMSTMS